jgi:hypothetical protein
MNCWPIIVPSARGHDAGFAALGAVAPSAQLFGPTLHYNPNPKTMALTFDDRPNPAVTLRLLDLFDRYSVRAIFCLMGRFARVPRGAAHGDIVLFHDGNYRALDGDCHRMLLNPLYLFLLMLQATRLACFESEGRMPLSEMLYG